MVGSMGFSASGELRRVLFTAEQIGTRVEALGAEITRDYQGSDLVVIGVLKGATCFTADLARSIALPLTMDWVAVSTYGKGSTAGTPTLLKDATEDVTGRRVLLIDDILDTGVTLSRLISHFRDRGADSVECCVLLRKPQTPSRAVSARYVGFDIAEHWVAGFGIDYAERHRNRPDIYEVDVEAESSARGPLPAYAG
jgi:hypoxanthine phosphoribosyltransferase